LYESLGFEHRADLQVVVLDPVGQETTFAST
jgi:hypothetical protein